MRNHRAKTPAMTFVAALLTAGAALAPIDARSPATCARSGATLSRRSAGLGLAAALGAAALPRSAFAAGASIDDIQALGARAKELRAAVHSQGAGAASLVTKGLDTTLDPLQKSMLAAAKQGSDAYTQAQLMQGHLLELRQALKSNDFSTYVSKTTKATYPGGKVERELEEVSETFDDYIKLVAAPATAGWGGRYSDPNHPRGFRDISVGADGVMTIVGKDEPDGPTWKLTAKVEGTQAKIDFSPKGGPKDLLAVLGNGKITFPDGNACAHCACCARASDRTAARPRWPLAAHSSARARHLLRHAVAGGRGSEPTTQRRGQTIGAFVLND